MITENDMKEYQVIPGHVFVRALLESVERMSGFILTEIENDQEAEPDNEIIGAMVLQGQNSMLLTLETNKNSAAPLVSFMTGIATEDLDEALLNDGITELINMVGGSARASLEATNYKFFLSVPFTLVGESVEIVTKKRTDSFIAKLVCDQINLMLRIYKL